MKNFFCFLALCLPMLVISSCSKDDDGGDNAPSGVRAVDLGLSVKWASCNIGATSPEQYGDYFAWGEIVIKNDYSWSNYKWCKGSYNTLTKYCTNSHSGYNQFKDNKTTLDLEDDAAYVNWGGNWRMPTYQELEELINNCTWTWTDDYNNTGVAGRIVTSMINNNSIFLPAAGFWYKTGNGQVCSEGVYLTSSLSDATSHAYYLDFYNDAVFTGLIYRSDGLSVRPVSE